MNREDIEHMWKVASNDPSHDTNWHDPVVIRFAALVASAEREKLRGQIETLGAMYELASRQRDELMAQQRADIEEVRRKMQ